MLVVLVSCLEVETSFLGCRKTQLRCDGCSTDIYGVIFSGHGVFIKKKFPPLFFSWAHGHKIFLSKYNGMTIIIIIIDIIIEIKNNLLLFCYCML